MSELIRKKPVTKEMYRRRQIAAGAGALLLTGATVMGAKTVLPAAAELSGPAGVSQEELSSYPQAEITAVKGDGLDSLIKQADQGLQGYGQLTQDLREYVASELPEGRGVEAGMSFHVPVVPGHAIPSPAAKATPTPHQ